MSDYPNYFPKFLRDFHALKYFSQAFFVYLDLMDKKQTDSFFKRRSSMCSWIDFAILLASLMDFLHWMGYDIQKTRQKGEYVDTSITEDMRCFPEMYRSLTRPGETLT